jgi:hypothetical protein
MVQDSEKRIFWVRTHTHIYIIYIYIYILHIPGSILLMPPLPLLLGGLLGSTGCTSRGTKSSLAHDVGAET